MGRTGQMDKEDGRGQRAIVSVSLNEHEMHMTAGAVCFTGPGF